MLESYAVTLLAKKGSDMSITPPMITLGEMVSMPMETIEYAFPGLLPTARNVFFQVAPGVDFLCFANLIAFSMAGGARFPPYGTPKPVVTLVISCRGYKTRTSEQMVLNFRKRPVGPIYIRARNNLLFRYLEDAEIGKLTNRYDQDEFVDSLPPNCRCVLFHDAHHLIAKKQEHDVVSNATFGRLLSALNEKGIATFVFFKTRRKASSEIADELFQVAGDRLITLSENPAAPREYGGGCTVERPKTSEHEDVPLRFSFWYSVIDDKLEYGWECRDPADANGAKQIEMLERRKRVQDMLERGMPQKEIAGELGVDAATISRDVAKVRAAIAKKATAESGDEDF
ncbi:MAG: hypothetical protein H6R18_275 [Proteobacteria bacterium]|nr:hypothetical protein [Pseudomonadota bacterium]